MWDDERHYLERRAEDELDCAQNAMHPAAIKAHYELLGYYLNRLYPEAQGFSGQQSRH
jgi:hypothetical protein